MKKSKKYSLGVLSLLFLLSFIIYIKSKNGYYSLSSTDEESNFSPYVSFDTIFKTDVTPLRLQPDSETSVKMILINLDKRKERLNRFKDLFDKSDLYNSTELYRISAVDGKKHIKDIISLLSDKAQIEFKIYTKNGKRAGHHSLTEGGIGCYLSHILAWNHVKNFGVPCIVAEDDIIIPSDVYKKIQDLVINIEELPKDKPRVVLFHSICKSYSWDKLECVPIDETGIYKVKQFWSTAFYYITPEAADVLLRHAFPIKYQIDHMMSLMSIQKIIDIYFIKNIVSLPLINDTDIQVPLL
jgi:GR25 family glycosyltransferase involved in LPS biosynthesis